MNDEHYEISASGWHTQHVLLVCEALLDMEYRMDDPPPRVAHARELARVLFDSSGIPLRAHEIEDYESLSDAVAGTPHSFEHWVAM